jgi:hypothetical protein
MNRDTILETLVHYIIAGILTKYVVMRIAPKKE